MILARYPTATFSETRGVDDPENIHLETALDVDEPDVLTIANRNSFQVMMKAITAHADTPGQAIGTSTCQSASQRVRPSMRAAFSIFCGSEAKKPLITQVTNGVVSVMCTAASASRLP